MKKQYFYIILSVCLMVVGCVSTPVSAAAPIDNSLYYENQQTGEKLRIEQWKYMGFEQQFPKWVIPALEDNPEKIKMLIPELANAQVVVLKGAGYNTDQSENALKEQKVPEGYKFYDSFWVKCSLDTKNINKNQNNIEKMYISVAVYYK